MKRFKVLFGNRRMMVLLTLAVLVLAATALVASSASFTATSANTGNIFTAGTLTLTDTGVMANISKIMPDDAWHTVGTLTLGNTGDKTGHLTMTSAITDDSPGAGGGHLPAVLLLKITRGSDNVVIYNGHINTVGTVDAGNLVGTTGTDTYKFEVQFPDGDTLVSGPGADNAYKLSAMTIGFTWEIVNL